MARATKKTGSKTQHRKRTAKKERRDAAKESLALTARDVTNGLSGMLEAFSEPCEDEGEFAEVIATVTDELRAMGGIGTLAEKSTHAVLKRFYAGNVANEEVRLAGFVADVVRPPMVGAESDGLQVFEIQTRGFYSMRRKLEAFLQTAKVTIVYPVVHRSTLSWIDPDSGEVSTPKKTAKVRYGYEIMAELYSIRDFLSHPNLSFRLEFLQVEMYKMLDGFGPDKKVKATKNDGIPKARVFCLSLEEPKDYLYFLPDYLPETFTSAQYAAATRTNPSVANKALTILLQMRLVERVGKVGNAFIYKRI